MSNKKSKFSDYKLAVFAAIIGGVVTLVIDWVKAKPILSTLWSMLKWIWETIFEHSFTVWQIIIGVLVIYFLRKVTKKEKQKTIPEFLKYRSERIGEIVWKWGWGLNQSTGQYNVQDLVPICEKCQTPANYKYNPYAGGDMADCPRCNHTMSNIKEKGKVEAVIIDNVDKGNYLGKANN